MSAPTPIHVPLDPMTLEIHPVSSSHVSWVYKWSNVDLSSKVESFSPDFGHANGWVWRLLLQHHTNPDGNRIYSLFLYVVLTDTELREPTWTRKIRVMQFQILNSEGRRLKDKNTIALFNEHQLTWGFPGLIDNTHLLRDPVVAANKKVDIICRLRYLPEYEKIRRPMSPPVSGVYGRSPESTTPDMNDHNAAAKVFDPRAVVVDPVGNSLRTLVNNPTFSDIQIVVGPDRRQFYGHKAILAARSVWFESALNPLYKESHEGVIRLPEEDPTIFEMLFEFLYTGDYPLATAASMGLITAPTVRSPTPKIVTIRTEASRSNRSSPSSTPSPRPAAALRQFRQDKPVMTPPGTTRFKYGFDDEDAGREMDLDEFDDVRYQLYLMADKYGVSQLKCLIRVHLTNELLDPSSGVQQQQHGQRLLKLIRFAFEELPEAVVSPPDLSTGTALRCPPGMSTMSAMMGARHRDSGLGDDTLADEQLVDRGSPGVPAFERVYPRGANGFTSMPQQNGGQNHSSTPDGSNAARVLSSVFAPPPPPQVTLPIGTERSERQDRQENHNSNGNPMHQNNMNNGQNSNRASPSPGPGGAPLGLFGNGAPLTQSNLTSANLFNLQNNSPGNMSAAAATINARTELMHQRDTPSRVADRDTRRGYNFRGGWQSSTSNITTTSNNTTTERQGRYGRDNETALMRDAIVMFVAKMFPAVRRIDGFEDLMKEGGDMGGFATEVMDRMFSRS